MVFFLVLINSVLLNLLCVWISNLLYFRFCVFRQVKIWFQNKRAKLKKGCGVRNPLAQLLMEEGLYNHSTIVVRDSDSDSNNSGAKIGAGK